MSKHNAIAPRGVEEPFDPLSELLLQGAKQLVHQAVDAELHELLRQFEHCPQGGNAVVVRNGYLPERTLQTGVGAVSVRVPKVRSRTGAASGFPLTAGTHRMFAKPALWKRRCRGCI